MLAGIIVRFTCVCDAAYLFPRPGLDFEKFRFQFNLLIIRPCRLGSVSMLVATNICLGKHGLGSVDRICYV